MRPMQGLKAPEKRRSKGESARRKDKSARRKGGKYPPQNRKASAANAGKRPEQKRTRRETTKRGAWDARRKPATPAAAGAAKRGNT